MILDALHHQITHELVQIVETRCSARSDGFLDPPLCGYIFISYSMSTLFVFGNHVCTVYIFLCTVCVSVWLILCVRLSICVSVYLLLCSVFVWCFCLCLCVYVSVCFVFCCNVVSLCYLYNRVQSAGGVSPLNASQTAPVPSPRPSSSSSSSSSSEAWSSSVSPTTNCSCQGSEVLTSKYEQVGFNAGCNKPDQLSERLPVCAEVSFPTCSSSIAQPRTQTLWTLIYTAVYLYVYLRRGNTKP